MSGFQDVRDVMEISGPPEGVPRPPPPKKQKTVEKRPGHFSVFFLLNK
jgi:DNA methyltransferase 1-associated protein 1